MKKLKPLGALIIVAWAVFGFWSQAQALSISPVRYEISADPGEIVTDEVLLFNETDKAETYYSSFANFGAQGETGNPAFLEPKDDLGTWITTYPSITIPANTSASIPFTIRVPKNAEPGGHFAVMFFGDAPPSDNTKLAVGAKLGTLVLLSVNGEVKEAGGMTGFGLKEGKFFYKTLPVDFEYKFRNDGQDRIKPSGHISIRNNFYLPADKVNANKVEGNILPNSTRLFEVSWIKKDRPDDYKAPEDFTAKFLDNVKYEWNNFALGLYFAKLDLSYGSNLSMHSSSGTKVFLVFPWELVLVMIAVFFVVFVGGKGVLKKYNRYIIEKAKAHGKFSSSRSHDK